MQDRDIMLATPPRAFPKIWTNGAASSSAARNLRGAGKTVSLDKWLSGPLKPLIARDQVHVWKVDLGDGQLIDVDAVLSDDERKRAARFHFERDRYRFKVARASLRTILGRYLQQPPGILEFGQAEYGKPFLRNPSAEALRFNLSHSRDIALVAVTREQEVGVDVEFMRTDFATEEVAERFFSYAEREELKDVPTELQARAFYNCWTRKEAYIKARGEGISLQLDSFDVSLIPDRPAALLKSRLHPEDVSRWKLSGLFAAADYGAALAVAHDTSRMHQWQFNVAE